MTATVASPVSAGSGTAPATTALLPRKDQKMFEYLVTTTDGYQVTIKTAGDPTIHPAVSGRVYNVYTVGQWPRVDAMSDPTAKV